MRWSEEDGELNTPENEVRDHLLRCYADRFRDVVGDIEKAWPDGSNDLSHGRGTGVGLNGVPEESRYHTHYDGESRKIPPKG